LGVERKAVKQLPQLKAAFPETGDVTRIPVRHIVANKELQKLSTFFLSADSPLAR
jgi:hypothetical protein